MTTDYTPYFTIPWQYPAIISIPFFLAAIQASRHDTTQRLDLKIAASGITIFLLFAPATPLMTQFSASWAITLPDNETILKHTALNQLEPEATILAQENIFPNIADRKTAYTLWPTNTTPPDYIVVDVQSYYFYTEPVGNTTQDQTLHLLETQQYGITTRVNGFFILKHDYTGNATTLAPIKSSIDITDSRSTFVSQSDYFREAHFFVPDSVAVEDGHITIHNGTRGSVWWGPFLTLPPGRYRVTITLDAEKAEDLTLLTVQAYWYKRTTYSQVTISGDMLDGEKPTTLAWEFTLTEWTPSLEVVGISHGWTEIHVHDVTIEGIT
jgi:hypothetical protein